MLLPDAHDCRLTFDRSDGTVFFLATKAVPTWCPWGGFLRLTCSWLCQLAGTREFRETRCCLVTDTMCQIEFFDILKPGIYFRQMFQATCVEWCVWQARLCLDLLKFFETHSCCSKSPEVGGVIPEQPPPRRVAALLLSLAGPYTVRTGWPDCDVNAPILPSLREGAMSYQQNQWRDLVAVIHGTSFWNKRSRCKCSCACALEDDYAPAPLSSTSWTFDQFLRGENVLLACNSSTYHIHKLFLVLFFTSNAWKLLWDDRALSWPERLVNSIDLSLRGSAGRCLPGHPSLWPFRPMAVRRFHGTWPSSSSNGRSLLHLSNGTMTFVHRGKAV